MPVHFTLATYPGETFEGNVTQVRLNAQSTQNVVTYTVVVATDNPPTAEYPFGKLFPCMTADLKFEIERHADVLLVPNVALRWKPQPSQIAPDARRKSRGCRACGGETTQRRSACRQARRADPQPPKTRQSTSVFG